MTEVMGYPTKTAAVLALRAKGIRITEVARISGISPNAASGLEHSGKRNSGGRAARPKHDVVGFVLPQDIRASLRPHAAKRGLSTDRLIIALITAVAESNLVDAVLDDNGGAA